MKHTLLTLTLALLPLAAADTAPATTPSCCQELSTSRFCRVFARPLPGGGRHIVTGCGEVMQTAGSIVHTDCACCEEDAPPRPEVPSAVPDNRVTRALNCLAAVEFPENRPDGADDALWAEDAAIPADKVLNLWRAAVDHLSVFMSWFCDEAGDNFVIVSTDAACYQRYHMFVYQWDEGEQAFRRRGEYTVSSRTWSLCPMHVEFLPEGLKVVCTRSFGSPETREFCSHLFPWTPKVAEHSLIDWQQ